MWYILLIGLVAQGLATQVTYHTTSQAESSASSSSETKDWSWQEPLASASGQQDDYHPLSFTASDALAQNQGTQQQNPNVQSDTSGVAEVLDQFTQQSVSS